MPLLLPIIKILLFCERVPEKQTTEIFRLLSMIFQDHGLNLLLILLVYYGLNVCPFLVAGDLCFLYQ